MLAPGCSGRTSICAGGHTGRAHSPAAQAPTGPGAHAPVHVVDKRKPAVLPRRAVHGHKDARHVAERPEQLLQVRLRHVVAQVGHAQAVLIPPPARAGGRGVVGSAGSNGRVAQAGHATGSGE